MDVRRSRSATKCSQRIKASLPSRKLCVRESPPGQSGGVKLSSNCAPGLPVRDCASIRVTVGRASALSPPGGGVLCDTDWATLRSGKRRINLPIGAIRPIP
ncbi:hypothetical protein BV22DRAFT_125216 [Leucogyrophana mollusca]|uniref:Uncharacterized protein n=1 Tax=Leucogyrophana mollusca TaxID=85980 RepID=A0ACB8BVD1_9AGAM|nr:hypothetical protein BV22DRAFT_125216 [Leucogyrophana mollusca]